MWTKTRRDVAVQDAAGGGQRMGRKGEREGEEKGWWWRVKRREGVRHEEEKLMMESEGQGKSMDEKSEAQK